MTEPHLSVVIPFFNENRRLEKTLPLLLSFIDRLPFASEILLVDDGSTDRSLEVVTHLLKGRSYALLRNAGNQGKGSAVRQGMLAAQGKFILFSDADLSTPLEEVLRFLPILEREADLVIGSRALRSSRVEIHQARPRELMGKFFNRIARLLSFRDIQDSQCGFKCFRRGAARDLFSRQKLDGFAFDAEILFLAQRLGYRIREEAVIWRNDPQSKVHLLRDPVRMFFDLLRIRLLHRRLRKAEAP